MSDPSSSQPASAAGRRRSSRRLDLRQKLFRIPSNVSIDLGLQWSFVGADPVDLDASCVAMGKHGECLDVIFFGNLVCEGSVGGAYMRHSGDNTTGEDDGEDDESLHFVFANVPDDVYYLMVCVTSYTGADFTLVERAVCNLSNAANNEHVGEFQLGLVGAHTATLLCCISRVDPTPQDPNTYWDLRELGLPTNGFTFVEVVPLMQELIAVPEADREGFARLLPNYGLIKDPALRSSAIVPSIMKFCIGWDGDNDVDCFLVMLNDQDDYIDHVYAKVGKLISHEGAAKHSGDKLNGFAGDGDDEYIDIDVNRLRKDVHRVFFVVTLHSGFALSLGDVPNCYCRMQNKTPTEQLVEVDRTNITKRAGTQRTMLFSALVRKDPVRFEYVRLHEPITCGSGDYIEVLPWLRLISSFLSERLMQIAPLLPVASFVGSGGGGTSVGADGSACTTQRAQSSGALLRSQSIRGQRNPGTQTPRAGGEGGEETEHPRQQSTTALPDENLRLQPYYDKEWPKHRAEFAEHLYGIEIRPIRVEGLGPLEPHQFACHVKVWVCDRKCRDKGKTSICHDREAIEWSDRDPQNRCRFAVHRFDRIRLMVFEHSVAAFADLEIQAISAQFFTGEDVTLTLPLRGKEVTGEVTFVCRHIPIHYVPGYEPVPWYKTYICSVM